MAIEIIPKPAERIPDLQRFLLYFSIFTLLGLVIGYFVLVYYQNKSEAYLQELESSLQSAKTPEFISLEKEILNSKKKIQDFTSLLEQHIFNSKVFEFLELKTHPKIYFYQADLDSQNSELRLSGQADSFLALGQQLSIFEAEPSIEKLSLSQVNVSKGGKVDFGLSLNFNSKIFIFTQ